MGDDRSEGRRHQLEEYLRKKGSVQKVSKARFPILTGRWKPHTSVPTAPIQMVKKPPKISTSQPISIGPRPPTSGDDLAIASSGSFDASRVIMRRPIIKKAPTIPQYCQDPSFWNRKTALEVGGKKNTRVLVERPLLRLFELSQVEILIRLGSVLLADSILDIIGNTPSAFKDGDVLYKNRMDPKRRAQYWILRAKVEEMKGDKKGALAILKFGAGAFPQSELSLYKTDDLSLKSISISDHKTPIRPRLSSGPQRITQNTPKSIPHNPNPIVQSSGSKIKYAILSPLRRQRNDQPTTNQALTLNIHQKNAPIVLSPVRRSGRLNAEEKNVFDSIENIPNDLDFDWMPNSNIKN